jgi:hypothetical protein
LPVIVSVGRYAARALILGSLKASSMSFFELAWARIGIPLGKPLRPFTWSPSLWVSTIWRTGFGVILAISASMALAESSLILASITVTPVLPAMKAVLAPLPPFTR